MDEYDCPGLGGGIGECPFFGCVPNCSIFTCGPVSSSPGGGGGGAPAPKPAPPSTGFTLGLRLPNQSFNQCMLQNATNYSAGGVFDLVTGSTLGGNGLVQLAAGNTFTTAYAGVLGGSLSSATGAATSTAPDFLKTAIGSPLSYGRRTADIMALNLEGKGGLPLALSPVPEIGEIKSVLGSASGVLNLGLDAATKGAIDAGLFGAEVIGCSISQ